jgi:hypothetical protein
MFLHFGYLLHDVTLSSTMELRAGLVSTEGRGVKKAFFPGPTEPTHSPTGQIREILLGPMELTSSTSTFRYTVISTANSSYYVQVMVNTEIIE